MTQPTSFNICVVKPEGYAHSAAFLELVEVIAYALSDLGCAVETCINRTNPDALNIIVGCHLLDPSVIEKVPDSTIVLNTEQIYEDDMAWNRNVFAWARRFETWDYSERNIERLRELGARSPKLLRIGFHPALVRIPRDEVQDIDVLFYGSLSERRAHVLDGLREAGLNVHVAFGVYGEERDALVARAKVVLNVHHYSSKIFEIVRVFYLMANSKAVVCEVDEGTSIDARYLPGIQSSRYDELVRSCALLVEDQASRRELELRAFETIADLPQAQLIAPLIDRVGERAQGS